MPFRQSLVFAHDTHRLVSLDVFRGIVIGAMILVTNPGTYSHTWPQLRHAVWNGATATDMIFPAFLFMVGLAIPLSLGTRRSVDAPRNSPWPRILRRGILLLMLGLAVNGFPEYDWHTLRLPGILQRIAVCYVICAGLYSLVARRTVRQRTVLFSLLALLLLVGYWLMLKLVPVPGIGAGHLDPYGVLPAFVDRQVFGLNHLWQWGIRTNGQITFDPEGILSTIPALTLTLAGMATMDEIRSAQNPAQNKDGLCIRLLALAAVLVAVGLVLNRWLPLNKMIFTSTFAMLSTGISLAVFTLVYWLIDLRGVRRGILPALVLGTNAIVAFVLSNVMIALLDLIRVQGTPLHGYLYDHAFATWLPPTLASHTYALCIVIVNLALVYPLYRKRLFVRL